MPLEVLLDYIYSSTNGITTPTRRGVGGSAALLEIKALRRLPGLLSVRYDHGRICVIITYQLWR
jgi:hypothetical protein